MRARGMCILLFLAFFASMAEAGTTYVATTAGQIQSYGDMLLAGDTLLVQAGEYELNWNITGRMGTPSDWIIIAGTGGDVIIRGTEYDNVVDVRLCSYVHFRGFEITTTNAGYGIDGIKFKSSADHFIIEDCHIHHLTGVGISATSENTEYLTVRYCHIHDIGGVGEGIYLGSHDGSVVAHHCLVEWNWIHDTHPRKGIQIKRKSYLNVIQDNVIYSNDEAGIVLYKTDRPSSADNNVVRRNVIWNTPEGIFAIGQTDMDNNIIFDCKFGISTRNYSGWGMEDLFIRNNTVYDCDTTCLMLDDWNTATGQMICVNNACYQDSLSDIAIAVPFGIGPGLAENNRHYGIAEVSGSAPGLSSHLEFVNASIVPGVADFYPQHNSTLRDSGSASYGVPNDDFNLLARPANGSWDVGAYEWSQSGNPGWQIQAGFKEAPSALHLYAQLQGDQLLLHWSPWPGADSIRVFRDTIAHFEPDTVGFANMVAVLSADSARYSDSFGVGDPGTSAFYRVMAWSQAKSELGRSETVGEFDASLGNGTK
jgi:parallel beta-helix repeat protein